MECSGVAPARVMAVLATKRWGQSHSLVSMPVTDVDQGLAYSSVCPLPNQIMVMIQADVIGGYNDVTLQVSPWVIQKQLTIKGSWTCCKYL
jgi:hypothetical protein